jgi:hypothetical protein
MMERDDAVPGGESGHACAGGNHCTSRLMTEDTGAWKQIVLDLL